MRVNHVVLKVRSLERSIAFYERVLDFVFVTRLRESMAFLRAPGSPNHHDLGLLRLGDDAPDAIERAPGLLHVAWQVEEIAELPKIAARLEELGALHGTSDHGASKSLYGLDPDGNEFEVMWQLPREAWGEYEYDVTTRPLDLTREIERFAPSSLLG